MTTTLSKELDRARRDPLSSAALGTSGSDLIRPCRQPRPPAPAATAGGEPPLALALSGGGFRASLAALGVLQFLADAGLLARVGAVSSVSGGSVAHALFARHYRELEPEGFSGQALDRLVIDPFIHRISGSSLKWTLVRNAWRILGPKTRTQLLADALARWFYGDQTLVDLPVGCRFVFNAANLTSGVRFGFEATTVGDYVLGHQPTTGTGLRLADAVAASAALPGVFAPLVPDRLNLPCADGRVPRLVDGGAYDNMGLEAVDDPDDAFLIALNAGGLFHTGRIGGLPLIGTLSRANSLLYRQTSALRQRWMVDRFRAWEHAHRQHRPPPAWARRGILIGLGTTFAHPSPEWLTGRPGLLH